MALSSRIKHVLQCICLFSWVFIFCYVSGGIRFGEDPIDHIDPWTSYGPLVTLVLMLVRLFALLALPQTLCNLVGLISLNTFPDTPKLKSSPLLAPFICVRVVTRGIYPNLVKKTVRQNLNTLLDVGLENFTVQVRKKHHLVRRSLRGQVFSTSMRSYCSSFLKALKVVQLKHLVFEVFCNEGKCSDSQCFRL